MAVVQTNARARLRITDTGQNTIKTFNQIRPNISAEHASDLRQAVMIISELPTSGARLIVTSTLTEVE